MLRGSDIKRDPGYSFIRSCRGRKSDRGYSLVEIIISVAILALVLLSVLQVMTMMLRMERKSRDHVYTASLAQGFMEKIKEAPYDSIQYGATLPPSNIYLPNAGEQLPIEQIAPVGYVGPMEGYFSVAIDERNDATANSNYKLVTITVGWFTPGSVKEHHQVDLTTRLYPVIY